MRPPVHYDECETAQNYSGIINESKAACQWESKTDLLDTIKRLILGKEGKDLVQEAIDLFDQWKPIRLEVQQLTIGGNRHEAIEITRSKGARHVLGLERKMGELAAYANNKADGFIEKARYMQRRVLRDTVIFICAASLVSLMIAFFVTRSILASLSALKDTMNDVTRSGDLVKSELGGNNEITDMAAHFNQLLDRLKEQFWVKDGQNALREEITGDLSFEEVVQKATHFLSRYVNACTGALYLYDEKSSSYELKASYAFLEGKHYKNRFSPGQGVVGQVAVERMPIHLTGITEKDAFTKTGTVDAPPKSLYAMPLVYQKDSTVSSRWPPSKRSRPLKSNF